MHLSLDGFVAGPNGEMDWIRVDEEMFDYAGRQTDRSDTALYGRVTYQMMDAYWPTAGDKPNASKHDKEHSAWYNTVEKVVLSNSLTQGGPKTRFIAANALAEVKALKQKPGNDIVIFGSPRVCHALMAENLIDEFWLFQNPILLGKGIPMFANIGDRVGLELLETKVFKSGVVGRHYKLA